MLKQWFNFPIFDFNVTNKGLINTSKINSQSEMITPYIFNDIAL